MSLILAHWGITLLLSPLFIGVIAKTKAFFAGRVGPSIFQPYFDLMRLFRKKCVYSRSVTWVFRASSVVVLSSVLAFSLFVPLGTFKAPVQFSGDILLVAAILAFARFFIIAAALETGFSMEGMGASREAFFACLSEMVLFMNFITLAILAHSMSLSQMIGAEVAVSWSSLGPVFLLVAGSFFTVLLAENSRIPIDDPDTHLELTMIHEVMILDHSGPDLAYMLYAAAIKLFLFAGILIPIVLPVQTGHGAQDLFIFLAGMTGLSVVIGVVESCMARLRLNRVRHLLLSAFALAFFGLVVTLWKA